MKKFEVDEKTLNEVLKYLSARPYSEVQGLISLILLSKEIKPEEKNEE
jgi:hypothetical protein